MAGARSDDGSGDGSVTSPRTSRPPDAGLLGPARRDTPLGAAVVGAASVGAALAGTGLVVAALAGLTGGVFSLRATVAAGVVGAVAVASGLLGVRRVRVPERTGTPEAFAAVVTGHLAVIAVSTAALAAGGTLGVADAVFESTAGVTTTALSALGDPATAPRVVLAWRAVLQWMGGLAAVAVAVLILPHLAVVAVDEVTPRAGDRLRLGTRHTVVRFRRLVVGWTLLWVAGAVLLAGAGMGPFDAATYAATTLSSGGFANHRGSVGHFGSGAVEWVVIGGMLVAGSSVALVVRGLRQAPGAALRSIELRAWLGMVVVASAAVTWLTADGDLSERTVRRAVFAVTSFASTTGHHTADWGLWHPGAQALLLAGAGVGAMAGAPGSGFRMHRALALVAHLRREVLRQLHRTVVTPVRLGRVTLDERQVDAVVGHQLLWLLTVAAAAGAFALTGPDLLTATSGALSAVANLGPALGDAAPGVATQPGAAGRLVLVPFMLAGRLEVAPLVGGVWVLMRRGRW